MADGTCNVSDCDHPAKCRGLCVKHYWQLRKGKPSVQAEAERYADPVKKSRWNKRPGDKASEPRPPGSGQKRSSPAADERIAAITEFATAIGIDRLGVSDGIVFHAGGRTVFLDQAGRLHDARFSLI